MSVTGRARREVTGGERVAENLRWKIGDVVVTRVVESVADILPAGLLPSSYTATIDDAVRPVIDAGLAEPGWYADPDTDREQSSATCRRLLAEHGGTDLLVIGTHFAPPCSAHLVRDDAGNG